MLISFKLISFALAETIQIVINKYWRGWTSSVLSLVWLGLKCSLAGPVDVKVWGDVVCACMIVNRAWKDIDMTKSLLLVLLVAAGEAAEQGLPPTVS